MEQTLIYFVLIPLAGFLGTLLPVNHRERWIYGIAITSQSILSFLYLVFLGWWFAKGMPAVHSEGPALYETDHDHFSIDFYFDRITAVYYVVASVIMFFVTVFSRYYMHREKGFKRFFNNIMFFYTGISFIVLAGNLETLFIGWEIIGVTSFFLIAFYRERYLPVKNALKVVSLYRVADVFLLLGIWICHHYFEKNLDFVSLHAAGITGQVLIPDAGFGFAIPVIFFIVALVKSAQFPFSSWLPRAMEGPTTSSAIFYGSLSVHIGVFLMMRLYPLYAPALSIKALMIILGLLTSILATFTARVQSSVKTQIAYSSISQIGLMFIEVALGLHSLALLHFAGNAFLRTYQLLVSPSVLSYRIHEQFFQFIPPTHEVSATLRGKISISVYMWSVKEWNLDSFMYRWLWNPLKYIGEKAEFINARVTWFFFLPLYGVGVYYMLHREAVPSVLAACLPVLLLVIALLMILRAFTKRKDVRNSWILVISSQLFLSLAVGFNEQFALVQIIMYLSGILISAFIGYYTFWKLRCHGEGTALSRFHGHSYEHPRLSNLFLLACLGLVGFPITPTFIGEDLILGHVHTNQFSLTVLIGLCLILDGLAVFRIYARLFLGPHEKTWHEIAYRSS